MLDGKRVNIVEALSMFASPAWSRGKSAEANQEFTAKASTPEFIPWRRRGSGWFSSGFRLGPGSNSIWGKESSSRSQGAGREDLGAGKPALEGGCRVRRFTLGASAGSPRLGHRGGRIPGIRALELYLAVTGRLAEGRRGGKDIVPRFIRNPNGRATCCIPGWERERLGWRLPEMLERPLFKLVRTRESQEFPFV
jgi:hypothetical protein